MAAGPGTEDAVTGSTSTGPGPGAALNRRWLLAAALVAVALSPLLFLGPGTDLDTGVVIRSGRSIVEDQTYIASRPPGAPVHEAAVGMLERLGGTFAANLGSLVMAGVCSAALLALLRREGVARPVLVVAVLVANPFFLIAATSTVDFLWALGFMLLAAVFIRDRRAVPAGVFAALAIGCRVGTAVLLVALLAAEWAEGAEHRKRALTTLAIAATGALLLYLPSYLAAGSATAFTQNEFSTSSPLVQLGKFGVKNLYFFGPFAALVLLVAAPALVRALSSWSMSWIVRFSAVGLLLTQLLYLRFPWKLGHLLPSLVCLVLLLGVALKDRPRLLVALVVAQLAYGVVNVQFVRPDNPNDATGGRATINPAWGALVLDTDCRSEDTTAWRTNDRARMEAVWNCAKPWASED